MTPVDPAVHEQLARDYEAAEARVAELESALMREHRQHIVDCHELRAKLAEAERERDALRAEVGLSDARRETRSPIEIVRRRIPDIGADETTADAVSRLVAEVERLRAELAETRQQPSEAPKVGDRVRVVRCCPDVERACCRDRSGHVGELLAIDTGTDEPFVVAYYGNGVCDGTSVAAVERVEEQPSELAEMPLTRGELVRALREANERCGGKAPALETVAEVLMEGGR